MLKKAVLLLLLLAFVVDGSKLHKILKDVGKRYMPLQGTAPKIDRRRLPYLTDYEAWENLSPKERWKKQKFNLDLICLALMDVSSTQNGGSYNKALSFIHQRLMPDFKAEICGEKTLNAVQFLKYMVNSGAQNKFTFYKDNYDGFNYTLVEGLHNDVLRFKTTFNVLDKTDHLATIEYNVLLKVGFENGHVRFGILELQQGGSCLQTGEINYSETEMQGVDNLIDDTEGLKDKPTFKMFSKIFRPASYQFLDENPNDLPRYWLSGINTTLGTVPSVCQEESLKPVVYSDDQFRSWYEHFGIMWHGKQDADDTFELQLIEIKEDRLVGRVTMKLQMGTKEDADVHKWEFKFAAGISELKTWYFETVDVLCDESFQYKDQSLINIRDIIGAQFVNELKYQNDTPWYSTVEFVRDFTKHGHVELNDCVKDTVTKTSQIDLFTKDKSRVHGTKFTKYQLDDSAVPSPAPDTYQFKLKTISEAAEESSEQPVEHVHEWTFDLKWDQMDQFYYIEKMSIGCESSGIISGAWSKISNFFG
ncbi:hypothetical protein B9Z55_007016 [Caenorhabditis nigoni]|uniref:NTF2-like domain-containing protein n=1 Tax=Caenorhabditis nigoni TaxID=1611254 RepID=A0A2G5V7N8_9PELO|nr:hypothetical protein B9Z55_007016 [Caenorhabditis nigoni]